MINGWDTPAENRLAYEGYSASTVEVRSGGDDDDLILEQRGCLPEQQIARESSSRLGRFGLGRVMLAHQEMDFFSPTPVACCADERRVDSTSAGATFASTVNMLTTCSQVRLPLQTLSISLHCMVGHRTGLKRLCSATVRTSRGICPPSPGGRKHPK